MNGDAHRPSFHLEFNSLGDFAAFVAIVRGDDLSKLPALAARLQKSTQALAAAEVAMDHATDPPT
jgi:hypothetical protein